MGRPTKYKPKYCRKLIEFFDIEPYEDIELPHYFNDEEHRVKWIDYKRVARILPTLRKFAKSIDVHFDTVYEWIKKHKKFSDAFTHAQEIRKEFLIDNALGGLYPPSTFKFVAVNLTDMRDVSEKDLNVGGQEGNPITIVMFDGTNTKRKVHKRSSPGPKKRAKKV